MSLQRRREVYLRTSLLSSRKLQQTLEKLRVTLGYGHSQWADFLRMKPAEYKQFCAGKAQVSIHACMELAQKYHFSLEDLWFDKVNLRGILANQMNDEDYINPRYSRMAFSRFQTARVMFDFLESRYGLPMVAVATRKF